jgi:hypothetical protein
MCFVCESPAKEIALTHVEVDSQIIADAAQRAQVIFSDAHLAKWPAPDDDDGHPKVIR